MRDRTFPGRKLRSISPKWAVTTRPSGERRFTGSADALEEDGAIYADHMPVAAADGLQYFEVRVDVLQGFYAGVGIFQYSAPSAGSPSPYQNISHRKVWWSDGLLESLKTTTRIRPRLPREEFSDGDVIGCGIRVDENILFLTKNGNWLGDYAVDARSDSRFAVFIHPTHVQEPSSRQRRVDLRISFGKVHRDALVPAQTYLMRLDGARNRRAKGHAPLPPEIISIIVHYVISGPTRWGRSALARLRLVCSLWNNTLRAVLFRHITIGEDGSLKPLLEALRADCWGDRDRTPLEILLLLGLGTHATQLQQLAWSDNRWLEQPVPPRVSSALPALVRHFCALHTLRLENRSIYSCAQLFAVIHALPSLEQLDLCYVMVDRVGLVRTEHVVGAARRLQALSWTGVTRTANHMAAIAAFVVRFRTGNNASASAVAEAFARSWWRQKDQHRFGCIKSTYKRDTPGTSDWYSWSSDPSNPELTLKWSTLPDAQNGSPSLRFLATLHCDVPEADAVESALKDLGPHLMPNYPITLALGGHTFRGRIPALQARLPFLMPYAHHAGLFTIEGAEKAKDTSAADDSS
ncbi:hypothetical protein PsYK624_157850 [Phanerochaete sordida]|uniref:B30.2/SPRY domain-containing protein n=1 Tax=Phanerochaete sordida TaxID=48140 RepID=A0A9P3LMB0_9APHY|nr:hypothetical protein PsYK624_157850 [Phanerochaete sordida]